MFYGEEENNWVCPSDRKLILRAKLHQGWSVHSHNVFRRYETLPDSEMMIILHVLSRSCQVQKIEHERVGNMVQRLANMKKNAWGDGLKSCAMCAKSLGWFKTSFPCLECQKIVCNKCCVDTRSIIHEPSMLCKICAENRELWKKSGGWFYGYLPIQKKNTDQISSPLGSSLATWSHRIPDIVCFESFEPPQNASSIEERFTGRTWASNSSIAGNESKESDLGSSEETIESTSNSSKFLNISKTDVNEKGGSMRNLPVVNIANNLELSLSLSSSCPSLVSNSKKREGQQQSNGILEFSLMHNPKTKVLQCIIHCIKELKIHNFREAKYYVKAQLSKINKKDIISRTKSVTGRAKMEYNEILVFSKIRKAALNSTSLRILIIMEGHVNDTTEGEISVDLRQLQPMESKLYTLSLIQN